MAYSSPMEFIENPTFTRLVVGLMEDDDYTKLQLVLATRPDSGKIIPGSGGIRKTRWAVGNRGKRGGLRVIYYWQVSESQIWMLLMYPKSEQDNLTHDQIKQLKQLVKEFES